MTSFNKTSKCALSILLAVMMLFSSVLTGADALTKNAQDTAQAAVETAVDTAAKIEADTSAETAAEEAAEEAAAPEQEAAAPEAEPVEADAAVAVTSAKADSAEVDAETVQTVAHVKKTPEKSGSSDIKRVYFHNNYKSNLSGDKKIYYFGGSHGLSNWKDRKNMNLVSGTSNLYYYDIPSDATTVLFEGNGKQTVDLDVTGTSEYIFIPTGTSDGKVTCSKSLYEIEIEDNKTYLLYYKNSYGWVPCYTYMFGSGDNAAWPGEFMSKVSGQENLYAIDISEGHSSFNQITFSDGTNIDNDPSHRSQNTDFSFSTDVYSNSSKKVWVPRNTTINEEDSGTKTRRRIYSTNLSDIIGTDDLSPCNLFAKDGTVRTSPYHYQKYADLADTVIETVNGSAPDKTQETYLEKTSVSSGDVVKITTTINSAYANTYYVKGFCVNGVTYGAIDEPAVGDSHRTSGQYSFEYTVPEAFTYIEITPIYFYFEKGGDLSNLGFVTFHVEKYTGAIQAQWGNTISCQTWYTGGDETVEGTADNKNALGGFPGQPLVFEDGDYYMQIPKKLPANGSSAVVTVQGMTLSNYYWDDVHHMLAAKDPEFKGSDNTRTDREINSQTYDFNDFAALASMGADDIIFTFKYRTKVDNRTVTTPPTDSLNNYNYSNKWNAWDGFVDYYDRAVDLSGHILMNEAANEPYSEANLLVEHSSDSTLSDTNKIWIVSKGYQAIKNNDTKKYYGNYATIWDIFTYNGSSFTKIGSLPGSSFIPPASAYETDSNGYILNNSNNKAKYLAFSDSSASYRESTFDTFVNLYNATLGKPAMIAFEKSITEAGVQNDPAFRCDGRWYYSTAQSGNVDANLLIEYKPLNSNNYNAESGYTNGTGSTTGATIKFTNPDNDDTTKVWKDNSGVHATDSYSNTEYFAFNADSYSTGANGKLYKFVGWYVRIGSNDTPINPTDLANVNGRYLRRVTNDFVAKYEEVDTSNFAIVDHQVLGTSKGDGKAYTTVQVYDNNNTIVKTYPKTQGFVQVEAQYLTGDYSINVTLTAEPDEYSTYKNGTYADTNKKALSSDWKSSVSGVWTKNYTGYELNTAVASAANRTITFYSEFDLNTLTVTYKYYDRALTPNAPVDISSDATVSTIAVNVPYKAGETVSDIILNGLNQKVSGGSISSVGNILDKYYLWSTQSAAVAGIQALPDYTVDSTGATLYSAGSYNFENHFNSIGKPAGDNEKWVNYTANSGVTLSGDESNYTPTQVSAVTVWAFNTPKLYDVKFFYPEESSSDETTASLLSNTVLPGNNTIYCIPESNATDSYLFAEKTFYGQRLGTAIGDGGNDPEDVRDQPGKHIANYGIKVGYTGHEVKAKQTVAGNNCTYVFDGWYDVATGAKIGSDSNYGYRVTTSLKLAAGYKLDSEPNAEYTVDTTNTGVSLTANDNDYYFDVTEGDPSVTEHIRFNTELNVYNSVDSNPDITDTAVVYIRMRVQGAGSTYTTEYAKSLLDNPAFMQQLKSEITANFNGSLAGSTTTTFGGKLVAIEYYYVYGSDSLTLNNKNRGMFTTSFKMSEVATNAPYSAIVAYGGIKLNDKWVLSDNFVEYVDVTNE